MTGRQHPFPANGRLALLLVLVCQALYSPRVLFAETPRALGRDWQLFVDDWLVKALDGAELRLHCPIPREVVLVHDQPWEGNVCCYHTVFRDGDRYRMYYRGSHVDDKGKAAHPEVTCYAESADGISWSKPHLSLHEFADNTENNIVHVGPGAHNLAPFRDDNPDAQAAARYKAVAAIEKELFAYRSPDGLRWTKLSDKPVITDGAFDSLNVAFWDAHRGEYRAYIRDFRGGVRDIKTATSKDFLHWSQPEWLEYGDAPREHLYTNAITLYPRSQGLLIGLPMRLVPGRNPEQHFHKGVSDVLLMSSRDGQQFHRWPVAFIRPGLQADRWVNRNNLPAWGIVETKSQEADSLNELSLYCTEGYYRGSAARLRRYTLRIDGFASAHAGEQEGLITTSLLRLAESAGGADLTLNFATSAAGSIRCEVLDEGGHPIPGYSVDESPEIYGDELSRPIVWQGGKSLQAMGEKSFRLRFSLRDADIYAISFQ
jgi:hypothetical protein